MAQEVSETAPDALVTSKDAIAKLGVSKQSLLRHASEWGLTIHLSPRGQRQYLWSEVCQVAAKLTGEEAPPREQIKLSWQDERECEAIAQRAMTSAFRKYAKLAENWHDDVWEDALLGVTRALAAPQSEIPWQVHCYNHATWQILQGIRKRSPMSGKQWTAGVRIADLPPERAPARSWEQVWSEAPDSTVPTVDPYAQALKRIDLERLLAPLSRRERMLLVNSFGHQFLHREIARDLGCSDSSVDQGVRFALSKLHEHWGLTATEAAA